MYKIILKTLLFLNILNIGIANYIRPNKRLLQNNTIVSDKIRCIDVNNTCICPGNCMDLDDTGFCNLKNCWEWTESVCHEVGPDYKSALIWQSVPFTGIFGAGFGNMGRWDIFGYGSILWGVGSIMPCILLCIYMYTYVYRDINPIKVLKIYFIIFCCIVLGYYGWGIYIIATKQITGPEGCQLIENR